MVVTLTLQLLWSPKVHVISMCYLDWCRFSTTMRVDMHVSFRSSIGTIMIRYMGATSVCMQGLNGKFCKICQLYVLSEHKL